MLFPIRKPRLFASDLHTRCQGEPYLWHRTFSLNGPALFIGRASRHKLIFELGNEALHRPGTGFAEGANGAPPRDVVGDLDEVICIGLSSLTMGQTMKGLGHPERAFPARSALATALVRVKLTQVRK